MKHLTRSRGKQGLSHHQAGMGLIEVMVSIILLSSVLLGAIALQFATAKEQRSAQFTSRAALLANEIGERMRANRAAMVNLNQTVSPTSLYVTATTEAGTKTAMDTVMMKSVSTTCTSTAACTALQTADYDRTAWWQNIRMQMPDDTVGLLLVPAAGAATVSRDVVIAWREPVTDKDQSGTAIAINNTNNKCPVSIGASTGMRCYVQRVTL
jgi:type IV pilus modification protein PilV